jgi:enamidase
MNARAGRGRALADDPKGRFQTLVHAHREKVAITSTLTARAQHAGRLAAGLEVSAQLRDQFLQNRARVEGNAQSIYPRLFPKAMALEREFARAGGLLVAGTDPTGGGGVIPGYANQRQLELLVEAGFTPLEAIAIGTRNGARYLGLEKRSARSRRACRRT